MAWTDAARRAAALARKLRKKVKPAPYNHEREQFGPRAMEANAVSRRNIAADLRRERTRAGATKESLKYHLQRARNSTLVRNTHRKLDAYGQHGHKRWKMKPVTSKTRIY